MAYAVALDITHPEPLVAVTGNLGHDDTTFARLPDDVFLHICEWLSVSGVLTLRSVNRNLYEITKNSTVWLSFLRRLTLALSSGQYLPSNSLEYSPSLVLETCVSRALKLEHNWRDYNPLPKHYKFNGHQRILTMKNLPGGKHMASVSQDPLTMSECIVIWDMNYRGRRNHVAIAMLNSETPVQKLQARYALLEGQGCLLVAFTRPPVDGKTAIIVTVITLDILENLSRLGPGTNVFEEYSKLVPNPFSKILETQTRYPVGALSLSDIEGHPILAAVHRPRTIVFYSLETGKHASLKLGSVSEYDNWRHSIWEIKILPSQNQILVIRVLIGGELGAPDINPIVFEVYDIPSPDLEIEAPTASEKTLIRDYSIEGFFVSDAEASWWSRYRNGPMLHELANSPPPPISIFVTTKQPRGFRHYLMLPEKTHVFDHASTRETPICVYKLPKTTHAAFEWDEEEQAMILPGAYRSIVWMRSPYRQPYQGIEVIQLAVYRTEGYAFSDACDTGCISTSPNGGCGETHAMDVDDGSSRANIETDPLNPRDRAMKYPVLPREVAQGLRHGMQALQFDEWLGRLCAATTEDSWLHVLDWSL